MTNFMAEWRTWGKSETDAASQTKGEGKSWNVKVNIEKLRQTTGPNHATKGRKSLKLESHQMFELET
jgi:hypothetical protein